MENYNKLRFILFWKVEMDYDGFYKTHLWGRNVIIIIIIIKLLFVGGFCYLRQWLLGKRKKDWFSFWETSCRELRKRETKKQRALGFWEGIWEWSCYRKIIPRTPRGSCDFYLRFGRCLVRFRGGGVFPATFIGLRQGVDFPARIIRRG